MRSAQWMDTAKFPTATFVAERVEAIGGDNYRVRGKFTLKGVTRDITVRATVRYRKEDERTREARFEGDVLQVTTTFNINLSDYNVTIPPIAKGKVNNKVAISVTVFGVTG
jgi:polyisoprenoid-binding protein YceI